MTAQRTVPWEVRRLSTGGVRLRLERLGRAPRDAARDRMIDECQRELAWRKRRTDEPWT